MIPYPKPPSCIAFIYWLIVVLYWIRSVGVRDEVNDVIYVILMNLVVPHFFMMDVDCGAQAVPIIAISTLNPSHISYPWYVFILYIVVCSFTLPAAISIRSSWFCGIKITTKSDVVGCHIGLSPSSTARNQSPIPVDCCVNVILPLMSSMVSFTAKMVVLRRVCEVPTQRQKLSPHWSNPPSTTN